MKINSSHQIFRKTAISFAMAATLVQATPVQADVLQFSFSGLLTYSDSIGREIINSSYPYYGDPAWGYGRRTQITGTLNYDTGTGAGTMTITPFNFTSFPLISPTYHDINLQSIGDGFGHPGNLVIVNMLRDSNSGIVDIPISLVWDATGLFNALPMALDETVTGTGTIPASNNIRKGIHPIGPAPMSTTSFNTTPLCIPGSCVGINPSGGLPLIADLVGGSPEIDGFATGFNNNFDLTSMTLTGCTGVCDLPNKVDFIKAKIKTSFSTIGDPTVYKGLENTVGNLVVQAKAANYPIDLSAVGSILDWVEVSTPTSLPDGVNSIRTYQQLGGFAGFTLVTVTGGNSCLPADDCEESVGPDSFVTTRENLVNVAITALMADKPVRWQKFCTFVYNHGSKQIEPICGFGKTIELD